MTLEEYKQQLEAHDWYYHMSDDPSKYSLGYDNNVRLKLLIIDNDEFLQAFNEEQAKNPLQ